MSDTEVVAKASFREVTDTINTLTDPDWFRLESAADYECAGITGWSGDELLNEALTRTLEGSRKWPLNVPFTTFLKNVMRSIVDELLEKKAIRPEVPASSVGDGEDEGIIERAAGPNGNPETILTTKQGAQALVARIEEKFQGNQAVLTIVAALLEGMAKAETMEMFDLTDTQYDTARRALRRARRDILGMGGES